MRSQPPEVIAALAKQRGTQHSIMEQMNQVGRARGRKRKRKDKGVQGGRTEEQRKEGEKEGRTKGTSGKRDRYGGTLHGVDCRE